MSNLMLSYPVHMVLKIFVDSDDDDLKNKYREYIDERNTKIGQNPDFIDAGFDLFAPKTQQLSVTNVNKVDYQVICSAKMITANHEYNSEHQICGIHQMMHNTGFYMYPRSSISKTPIRLANNTGIIDAGYRGHLIGMFDTLYISNPAIVKFDRHLQICAPGLVPIVAEMVETKEELGEETARGDGGFGSTGR